MQPVNPSAKMLFFSVLVPTRESQIHWPRSADHTPTAWRAQHRTAKHRAGWRTGPLGRGARRSLLDVFQLVLLRLLLQGRRQQRPLEDLRAPLSQTSMTASSRGGLRREYTFFMHHFRQQVTTSRALRPQVPPSGFMFVGGVRIGAHQRLDMAKVAPVQWPGKCLSSRVPPATVKGGNFSRRAAVVSPEK